jgi:hypothetical protein
MMRDVTTLFVGGYAIDRGDFALRHFAPAANSGAASETGTSEGRHSVSAVLIRAA